MAEVILRPSAVGNLNTLLTGGGTAVACVDTGDPVTHNDGTNFMQGELSQKTSYQTDEFPGAIATVNSIKLGMRAHNWNEGNCAEYAYTRIGTTDAAACCSNTVNAWTTVGPNTSARPGGGNWAPADCVNNSNNWQMVIQINGDAIIDLPRITSLWGVLDYTAPAGGWRWMLSIWVPPLLGAVGSNLSMLEIQSFLKREGHKFGRGKWMWPTLQEEFEKLEQALTVRPRFVFMGA